MPTISEIETALVARLALRNQKREEGNAASIAATDADNIVRANVGKDP